MSRFLSPHFDFSSTLVEINLGFRIFVARLTIWLLLLMSCLHLVVWPLICWSDFCSPSLPWKEDCDAFSPALWRLLVRSLAIVFGFLFTVLKWFPFVFHGQTVSCLYLSGYFKLFSCLFPVLVLLRTIFQFYQLYSYNSLFGLHVSLSLLNTNTVLTGKSQSSGQE